MTETVSHWSWLETVQSPSQWESSIWREATNERRASRSPELALMRGEDECKGETIQSMAVYSGPAAAHLDLLPYSQDGWNLELEMQYKKIFFIFFQTIRVFGSNYFFLYNSSLDTCFSGLHRKKLSVRHMNNDVSLHLSERWKRQDLISSCIKRFFSMYLLFTLCLLCKRWYLDWSKPLHCTKLNWRMIIWNLFCSSEYFL